MTVQGGTARFLIAASLIAAIGGIEQARADNEACRVLPAGSNSLSDEETCYALDVPEGTDMLRLRLNARDTHAGRTPPSFKLSHSVDPSPPGLCTFGDWGATYCTIPGPEAARYYLHRMSYWMDPGRLTVEFAKAIPVTGGTIERTLHERHDARMYRFDGLDGLAIISLASVNDLDLIVRRGAPPSLSEADCVSAQHTSVDAHPIHVPVGGAEACRLQPGAGSVFAFVRFVHDPDEAIPPEVPEVIGGCPFGITCYFPDEVAIFGVDA